MVNTLTTLHLQLIQSYSDTLQRMTEELHRENRRVGLKRNVKKTKIMFSIRLAVQALIGNETLEIVEHTHL